MKERFFANPVDLHINILQKPEQGIKIRKKSAFLGEAAFCGVFHEVKQVKKTQFTFSSQILSLEHNFFQ